MLFFHQIRNYIGFYRRAKTIYDIHSPLAAKLIKAYLAPRVNLLPELSKKRADLLHNFTTLQHEDYGAGSNIDPGKLTIASVARRSLSTARQLRGLYKLTELIKPCVIIELGTSFGLSALTMQSAMPNADLFSIEGNKSIHSVAQDLIGSVSFAKRPSLFYGKFQDQLPILLKKLHQVDLVFIDGDHTLKGTLENLESILPLLKQHSIVLIHDIYWSDEMKLAWQQCKQMQKVSMTIDFYDLGILIFDQGISQKQHYRVVPYWQKPWRIGLFA